MPSFGSVTTVRAAPFDPNLGINAPLSDALDRAAMAFGDDLLMRVDPRDIVKTSANPTGRGELHRTAPNDDPLYFMGTGVSVGPVSGKYNGDDVFILTNGGSVVAGTGSDLRAGGPSVANLSQFTLMGAAHIDASIMGSGQHNLLTFYRAASAAIESVLFHQNVASVDYLTFGWDEGAGGGANIDLDAVGSPIVAGTPFVYCVITKTGAPEVSIYINSMDAPVSTGSGINAPETGVSHIRIGWRVADVEQFVGAHHRLYLLNGARGQTAVDLAKLTAMMVAFKAQCGIA